MSARNGLLAAVLLATVVSVAVAADPASSLSRPADAAAVRARLGLAPWYEHIRVTDRVKVAVLDFGFDGAGGDRPYLPPGAVIVEHYDPDFIRRFGLGDPNYRKGLEPGNAHGRQMAQLVWAVTGNRPEGPKFYLLNANGPTLFRRAVRYAIEERVDVILFCGAFEGGGNFDGRGPINRVVDDAIAAGIIWVNSAGNFGRAVYNGPVPADGTVLHFRNRLDENAVTITLTWNDYRDEEDAGTDKDLDLTVEDADGKVLARGDAVQVAGAAAAAPGQSRNPRERVTIPALAADRGRPYRIRVTAKGGQFGASDRLRVLVTATKSFATDPATGRPAPAIELIEASGSEEIYSPADHAGVITIGDTGPSSSVGPTADGRRKPDVVIADARATFTGGELTAGSSNAAAYFAGTVAILKALRPELRAEHLRRHADALEVAELAAAAAHRPVLRVVMPEPPALLRAPVVPAPPPPEPRGAWRSTDGRIYVYSTRPPGEWARLANYRDAQARPLSAHAWESLRPLPPPAPEVGPPPRPVKPAAPVDPPAGRRRAEFTGPYWRVPDPTELKALVRPGA